MNVHAEDENAEANADELSEADVLYDTTGYPDTGSVCEEADGQVIISSSVESIIYGSPQAETYFRKLASGQLPVSDVSIDVDDLSARTRLVVRPLSSPDTYFRLPVSHPEVYPDAEPEVSDLYTDAEDRRNATQAAARVASLLNDIHRRADVLPVELHADRMSEAIVASALFETVFLSAKGTPPPLHPH